ncbi:MAG: transcription initiation factor IIB [Candidatus Diapherotrites archaeon]|nr:transcription initiation factor IIB [Candidatus Diapherotrites archaeon]
MVEERVCPECGSPRIVEDRESGEIICHNCGLVIDERTMDAHPEWRAFNSSQRDARARGGAPMKHSIANRGFTTTIRKGSMDAKGNPLSPQMKAEMYTLMKWHGRTSRISSTERNVSTALKELRRLCSFLGLPEPIIETASLYYRKTVEKKLIRGRLIESVVAAIVYMVCRLQGVPRTLDEIAEVSHSNKKEIGKTYRFLVRELGVNVPLTTPLDYVSRFASALGLSGEAQEEARKILKKVLNEGLASGRGPTGVAAAAVYIAGLMKGERRTQKEVADVVGVTEVTIRNRYRELKTKLGLDIPA